MLGGLDPFGAADDWFSQWCEDTIGGMPDIDSDRFMVFAEGDIVIPDVGALADAVTFGRRGDRLVYLSMFGARSIWDAPERD
jgi:hypothetical protein